MELLLWGPWHWEQSLRLLLLLLLLLHPPLLLHLLLLLQLLQLLRIAGKQRLQPPLEQASRLRHGGCTCCSRRASPDTLLLACSNLRAHPCGHYHVAGLCSRQPCSEWPHAGCVRTAQRNVVVTRHR